MTIAAGRPARVVWENELGGLTFEVGAGDDPRLREVVARWRCAGPHRRSRATGVGGPPHRASGAVPRPRYGARRLVDGDLGLVGCVRSRTRVDRSPRGGRHRARAWVARAMPTTCSPSTTARSRGPSTNASSVPRRSSSVMRPRSTGSWCVTGTRACAPNTVLDADGTYVGHVDVGRLGVADRWADLAVATWSTEWNYGVGMGRPPPRRVRGRTRSGTYGLLSVAVGPRGLTAPFV